jgi:hypothetical protein
MALMLYAFNMPDWLSFGQDYSVIGQPVLPMLLPQ